MAPALLQGRSAGAELAAGSPARAAWKIAARFPAPITAAAGATVSGLFGQVSDRPEWVSAFAGAFLWSLAMQLALECRPAVPAMFRLCGPWLAFVMLVLAAWPHGNLASIMILSAAGALAIVATPLVITTSDRSAIVRTWACQIAWAGGLAGAATLILCGGLSALIFGVDALFDCKLASQIIWRIWVCGFCLFLPCSALALLPLPHEDIISSIRQPAWLTGLLDWLIAPLVLAYGALLNAYCLFTLVQREWPKGVIALMVMGFAVAGLVAWIAAFAAGPEGGRPSRLLRDAFFPGLLAPAIALLIAVWIRVTQHGVTETRYLLVLAALLLLALGLGQVVRRRVPDPSLVALIVASGLLTVSVGPWGATGVSLRSQFDRLQATLQRSGRMRAGLIEAQGPPVSDADAAQISSATLFLVEHEEEAGVLAGFRVPPRMSQKHEDLGSDAFERSAEIVRAMGVQFMPYERPVSKDDDERFSWMSSRDQPIVVTGFDYIVSGDLPASTKGQDFDTSEGVIRLMLDASGGILDVRRGDAIMATFKVGAAFSPIPIGAQPVELESVAADGTRLRILITRVDGIRSPRKPISLDYASFHLLFGRSAVKRTR